MKTWARISSFRRSTMSARAPAGNANRNSGTLVATLTRETISGDGSRLVINHAVATLAIHPPILVMRTAIQTVRNAGTVSGLHGVAAETVPWGFGSATAITSAA